MMGLPPRVALGSYGASLTLGCNVWPLPGPGDKHPDTIPYPFYPQNTPFWATHNDHTGTTPYHSPYLTQSHNPQPKTKSRKSPVRGATLQPRANEPFRASAARG